MIRQAVRGLLVDPVDGPNSVRQIMRGESTRDELSAFDHRIALARFHPAGVAARTTHFCRELI